ncbi:MAG: proline dehydrogenase family protein [Pirellulales bacterium]|nr:proline dehydrogenase family protein [Pirellulales bacterium]
MAIAHLVPPVEPLAARDLAAIERSTQDIGRELFARLETGTPHIFARRWWDDRILAWAMRDESVKVQMFRFIDVLPMLRDSADVVRHLHEYFDDVQSGLPSAARLGLAAAAPHSVLGRALALAARRHAQASARRFIAGTTSEEVLAAAMRERKLRRAFTLDVLGEAVTSDREAERYLNAYLELIESLAPRVNVWPEVPQIDRAQFAELPRVNVSIKLSALDSHFDALDPAGALRRVAPRLRLLLRAARENRAHLHVDMESYEVKDLTLHVFREVLAESEFRDFADVGIVIQCYLRDAERDLTELAQWTRRRGTPVWVRLVKGAYWDYETVRARSLGWPVPVFTQKWQSDACYERATRFVLSEAAWLRPALGSHNLRSLAHGIATARHLGIPASAYEIQMLYGMADQEKDALVRQGHRVRVYMPYGELIPGMAYLVRRLLENTSNDSFLRAGFTEHVAPERLLMNPNELGAQSVPPIEPEPIVQVGPGTGGVFHNEPPTDFTSAAARAAFASALEEVRSTLGRHEPLVIGGRAVETATRIESRDPSATARVVGTTASAGRAEVDTAVAVARSALPGWHALGAHRRGDLLRGVAAQMRHRRFELAAWEVYECGKPWREADADVAEAIDFLEFYARGAEALEQPHGVDAPGEENRFTYLPRGVAAVIAPWNFPLAILTGMTAAALATGNTVVMKPAEQSPIIAARLKDLCIAAGLPPGVVNYLPGDGATAGAALVEHPDVALIAFTGSREVGLAIHRRAAEMSAAADSRGVKRVIAEMGGKNAILVDADADLDEAVLGIVRSAFGYSGQKCSACSRAVVHEAVYDALLERLVEAARSLVIAPAEDPGCQLGPLIDAEALERVQQSIALGRREGREVLSVDVGPLAQQGHFVGPHIFADLDPGSRLAQEEIFGPVLAVLRARDFAHGVEIVNATRYALTAGVYSRSPAHLEQARRELLAGNVYLNRPITGALVHRQPFGGFRLSGIGSQAGGSDYLLQFVVPRTVTENTLRRGFAPLSTGSEAQRSSADARN